jgi:hypothetical protein
MYIEIMLAAYMCERLLVSLGINGICIATGLQCMRLNDLRMFTELKK